MKEEIAALETAGLKDKVKNMIGGAPLVSKTGKGRKFRDDV